MVTISRQAWAGGDEIAQLLAQELGWRLLDSEAVERLLAEKGFPSVKRPDLWHRFSSEKARYLHLLKLVSYEFARWGGCLIVGRGGQLLFAGVPGIVRVRIIAPLEERIAKALRELGGDEHRARLAVQHVDHERLGFHRFLFHVNWESPDLYDLVIDTHRISAKSAAALILKTLRAEEITQRVSEAARRLENLYLAEKFIDTVLFEQKLPIHCLRIEVENGTIRLKGTAQDNPSIERCRELVATMGKPKKVISEVSFAPKFVELLAGIDRGASN